MAPVMSPVPISPMPAAVARNFTRYARAINRNRRCLRRRIRGRGHGLIGHGGRRDREAGKPQNEEFLHAVTSEGLRHNFTKLQQRNSLRLAFSLTVDVLSNDYASPYSARAQAAER